MAFSGQTSRRIGGLFITSGNYQKMTTRSNVVLAKAKPGAPLDVHSKLNLMKTSNSGFATLPKLPVPQLENTVKKFIELAKPLVSPDQYKVTAKTAEEFLASKEARELQAVIEQRARDLPNWLTSWWDQAAYLDCRTPLPIVTSPGVTFPRFPYSGTAGQIDYAAKITYAALHYLDDIENDRLAQDRAGNDPFDMSQYKKLFGTTRLPMEGSDVIQYGKDQPVRTTHIVVARNGHLFKVPVYDESGKRPLGVKQLSDLLKKIVNESEQRNPHPIGIVSADNRDTWARVYKRLKRIKTNEANLETIERALFLLCLDQPLGGNFENGVEVDEMAKQSLTGGGSHSNSINRWFDKTMQFVIGTNGYMGMCYEHTPAEGPPVANLMDNLCTRLEENNFPRADTIDSTQIQSIEKLDFQLNEADIEAIDATIKQFDKQCADIDLKSYTFNHFGKNVPKSKRLSPDSFIQIAFQLTFYRLHKKHPPTYETGTLRKYLYGRTDTIRLPNTESVQFVEKAAFSNDENDKKLLWELLKRAIDAHKSYSIDAMNMRAIDRHLLGLKLAAMNKGLNVPHIFNDPAYKRMMHFQLSTSQVPTRHFIPMCFGPAAPDCYGVCYNPQERAIHFTITAYKSCPQTSAVKFAQELENSLLQMEKICTDGTLRSKL